MRELRPIPPRFRPVFALLLILLLSGYLLSGCDTQAPEVLPPAQTGTGDEYLFCFWNVENLFDDQRDNRNGPGDKEYDTWFGEQPAALRQKLDKHAEALLKLNSGKGPDILAIVEVESVRAAQLLQQALNQKIADPALHYHTVLMKEVTQGRHIAPAILTRLPVVKDRTRGYGSRFRIIQGHIVVGGKELVVLASHWTSRLREGNEKGRREYADKLYGAANAIYHNNPQADILICGDFNDSPDDASVRENLHATGDLAAVRGGKELKLFNPMADKDPGAGFGTHFYNRWFIFDQIVVSPGLLDTAGWACAPDSVETVNSLHRPGDARKRPWRFGTEKDQGPRGYSDHFPVTIRLKVQR